MPPLPILRYFTLHALDFSSPIPDKSYRIVSSKVGYTHRHSSFSNRLFDLDSAFCTRLLYLLRSSMCILDVKHMDGGASQAREKCTEMNGSSPPLNLEQHKDEGNSKYACLENKENVLERTESVDVGQFKPSLVSATDVDSNLVRGITQESKLKNSKRGRPKGKKVVSKLGGRKYHLRSSLDGVRVLRSMSNGDCNDKNSPNTDGNIVHLNTENRKRRKRKKRRNRIVMDEFSRIRQRVRYLLSRMSYEQSLIEAYSGEGWRGQRQEKLKPEKELQRATSEILRCKLKVRENFQHIDSLCSEGKFQESLFDSDGQINAEDIFCAKCGSKDLSANNDVLLCDGVCDRGFHQKCLTPPLSSDEIPPGDESWLCPGCDCKVDCIELLNDIQGTDLSIEDKWEKVFPEAAASAARDGQFDDLGLPSDDSEDDDYDPDRPNLTGVTSEDDSNFEEHYSSSTSDDSSASTKDELHDCHMLSSDDSEDGDFDPNAPDINKNLEKTGSSSDGSSSDESDFSSDTDDLNVLIGGDDESPGLDEVTGGLMDSDPISKSSKQRSDTKMNVGKRKLVNSELQSLFEQDSGGEIAAPISGKRQNAQLDYKKLHDETYGDISSDSSDDEDWAEMSSPEKEKNDGAILSKGSDRIVQDRQLVVEARNLPVVKDAFPKPIIDGVVATDKTPTRKTSLLWEDENANYSVTNQHKDNPKHNGNEKKASRAGPRGFGPVVWQKLAESFKENQYPTRLKREQLAKEVGITVLQVSTWFANARRNLRPSMKKGENNAEIRPLGDQINGNVIELETKAVCNSASNESKDIVSPKEVVQSVMMSLDDEILNRDGKDVEPRAAVLSSCDSEGKHIVNKEAVFMSAAMGTVGKTEVKRKLAVSRSWDSAKYESRKRRMEMTNGSPNSISKVGGKPSTRKVGESSLQVQQPPKKGKNDSSHVSSLPSNSNSILEDCNPDGKLKNGKAADQSQINLAPSGGLAGGSIEPLAKGNAAVLPQVRQSQKRSQNATPYRSHIQTRSRRAST